MGLKIEGRAAIAVLIVLIAFLVGSGIGITVGISGDDIQQPVVDTSNNSSDIDLNVTRFPQPEPLNDSDLEYGNASEQNYTHGNSEYYSTEELKNKGLVNTTYEEE